MARNYGAEMASIVSNNTWELCNLPEGKHAVGLKSIYKTKCNAKGQVVRQKARLLAKGYSQKFGIDYKRYSSPLLI